MNALRRQAHKTMRLAAIEISEAKHWVMDIRGVGRRDGKRKSRRAQRRLDKFEIVDQAVSERMLPCFDCDGTGRCVCCPVCPLCGGDGKIFV